MSINDSEQTNMGRQQQEEIDKTMKYIAQTCLRCTSCNHVIYVTESPKVIKITCPMCNNKTWCKLCLQKWTLHGAYTGGLLSCVYAKQQQQDD